MRKSLIVIGLILLTILVVLTLYKASTQQPTENRPTKLDLDINDSETKDQTLTKVDDLALQKNETPTSTEVISVTPSSSTDQVESVTSTLRSFIDNFDQTYIVNEAGNISISTNEHWWLSSGGYFYSLGGYGRTIAGRLPETDSQRTIYRTSNPLDTDDGYQPQNIFRLVQKGNWQDFQQEVYFKILNENFSDSPNRNASNGIHFFNRYKDSFNLYYTGIRVDGQVAIKKKLVGVYTDMKAEKILSGTYDRNQNQNLLPINTWIGLRSIVSTTDDGLVHIRIYTDIGRTGEWSLALETYDTSSSDNVLILDSGHAGLRSDFLDVQFDNYSISSL